MPHNLKWPGRGSFLVSIFLLTACARPLVLPSYVAQESLASLSKDEVAERFRFVTRSCLAWAAGSLPKLKECERLSTQEERVRTGTRLAELHPEWKPNVKAFVSNGVPVAVGMTAEQVTLTLGKPDKRNSSVTSSGHQTQWVYRDPDVYVYLENGIVTSFQF